MDDSYDLDEFQTKTAVFNPKGSGIYKFNINGQILKIKVIDNNQIPDGAVYRWRISSGSGSELTDSISNRNITQSDDFKWVSGDYRDGNAIDLNSSTFATYSAISEIQSTKDWTVSCTVSVDSFVSDGVIWFNVGANAFDDSDFFIGTEGDRITLDNYTSDKNRIQIVSISGLKTNKNIELYLLGIPPIIHLRVILMGILSQLARIKLILMDVQQTNSVLVRKVILQDHKLMLN